jgi:hypothetical protein
MNLQLSIAMTVNPRTRPILDGSIKPDGIARGDDRFVGLPVFTTRHLF